MQNKADLRLLEACSSPSLEIKLLVALGTGPLLPHEVETASSLALDYEFEFVDAQALPGSVAGDASDSDEDFGMQGFTSDSKRCALRTDSDAQTSLASRAYETRFRLTCGLKVKPRPHTDPVQPTI